jgi:putative DNA primase/helicase
VVDVPAEERSNPVLEAARDEFRRGRAIIDLPRGSKVPGRSGWQHERYDEEALLVRLSGGPRNLSILFGEPSGGLVDVDLDCAEARALAAAFLPETDEVFGREGSPGSHLLYVTDPVAKYTKFSDPEAPDEDRATLVEIRSGGHHTIIPPSKHPSGQIVR